MKAKYKQRGVLSPVLDGSEPIDQSSPVAVAYEAWNENDQGEKSEKVFFTAGGTPKPKGCYFFGHNMSTMQDQSIDKAAEALYRKEELLHDFDWYHNENWDDIIKHCPGLIAGNEKAKHYFALGVHQGGTEAGQVTACLELMYKSEYAFKYLSGYVLFTYGQPANNVGRMIDEIEAFKAKYGVDVYIFKNGFMPYVMPGTDDVQGLKMVEGNRYPEFDGLVTVQSADMVAWDLNNYPWAVEVSFPAQGTTGENLIEQNKALIEGSFAVGKHACVADLAEYASDSGAARLSFEERKRNYEYVLSLPEEKRPLFFMGNTDNDGVEGTDMARTPNRGPMPGLGCYPKWNSGYLAGSNLRHPMPDHDGASSAFNPYKLALKQGLSAPVVTENKIFYSFVPHPKETEPLTEVPPLLANGDKEYARVFGSSMYVKSFDNQIKAVQSAIRNYTPRFDVLVWSLKDCQIEINGQRSHVMKAGICTWSVDLPEDYFGNIIVGIIVNNRSVLKCATLLPRLKTRFPAMYRTSYGYSSDKTRGTIQTAPVWKITKNGLELTGTGKLMVRKGGDIALPYDGPYKGNYPDQYFVAYKAATDTFEDGPVALSPAT